MKPTSRDFQAAARRAVRSPNLRVAMGRLSRTNPAQRAAAIQGLPEFQGLSQECVRIKDHSLAYLDYYLERFEARALARGSRIHWCTSPEQARRAVLAICREVGATSTITKGKSMVTEEIGLNAFLEANGLSPIETDTGEYIIQLAGEPPSHMTGPALHKTREEVAELYLEHHHKLGKREKLSEAGQIVAETRDVLRSKYFEATVGITGANFLVAETGSVVIVTNEGNGDLTRLLPKAHIVVTTIDRVVPTLNDVATFLRVLARSATGQEMTVYTSVVTGPRRPEDPDGPDELHLVLLDGGRSGLLGGELQPLLRCIRCAACQNHCPVYLSAGGHSYGWVYQGPIGAALDPYMLGLEEARALPYASTLCGKCEEVCPMHIPIPKILLYWREEDQRRKLPPIGERSLLWLWAFLARRPRLYRWVVRRVSSLLARLARGRASLKALPLAASWTRGRRLPAPEGRTFTDLWKASRQKQAGLP